MNEKNDGIFIVYIVRSAVEKGDFMKTDKCERRGWC